LGTLSLRVYFIRKKECWHSRGKREKRKENEKEYTGKKEHSRGKRRKDIVLAFLRQKKVCVLAIKILQAPIFHKERFH
jgi:hypothetical protein